MLLNMTKHFNIITVKSTRRQLRRIQTHTEKLIWFYLRNRKMLETKFRRQYSIDNYVIDFYCPQLRFTIEIDGDVHKNKDVILNDKKRQEYLENYGIHFLRIKNEELIDNPNKAFEQIEKEIKTLQSHHKSPSPSQGEGFRVRSNRCKKNIS